jgi:hypothetical protein
MAGTFPFVFAYQIIAALFVAPLLLAFLAFLKILEPSSPAMTQNALAIVLSIAGALLSICPSFIARFAALDSRSAEAERLAAEALPALKQIAGSPDGSDVELAITARSLLETEVRPLRDPKLVLTFAIKSSQMNGKDAEIEEILAEAYWFNGDRAHAIGSIQKSLTLIEQTPTPTRQNFEKILRRYQTAKLP